MNEIEYAGTSENDTRHHFDIECTDLAGRELKLALEISFDQELDLNDGITFEVFDKNNIPIHEPIDKLFIPYGDIKSEYKMYHFFKNPAHPKVFSYLTCPQCRASYFKLHFNQAGAPQYLSLTCVIGHTNAYWAEYLEVEEED